MRTRLINAMSIVDNQFKVLVIMKNILFIHVSVSRLRCRRRCCCHRRQTNSLFISLWTYDNELSVSSIRIRSRARARVCVCVCVCLWIIHGNTWNEWDLSALGPNKNEKYYIPTVLLLLLLCICFFGVFVAQQNKIKRKKNNLSK